MELWSSWLRRRPVTAEIARSSRVSSVNEELMKYSEFDLRLALIGLESREGLQEILDRIVADFGGLTCPDGAEFNRIVAEHHGISVLDLINSPNFLALQEQYRVFMTTKIHDRLVADGFSDKEAWAILMVDKLVKD